MLKRHLRLRHRRDINYLFRKGAVCNDKQIIMRALKTNLPQSRIMSIVSTKVDKRATRRNLLRRRVATIFQGLWPQLEPGWDIAVIVRNNTNTLTNEELQKEIEHCLKRLGVLN